MELSNEAIVSLAVVFTYIILSAVLLRWGGKLYKRSHTSTQIFTTRLIAHRGLKNDKYAENTLHAFKFAANQVNVDMIELDCWLSKDGQVVVFHDGTTDRMCGTPGHVNDLNYAEFPKLQLSTTEKEAYSSLTDTQKKDADRIPLLKEVLEMLDNKKGLIVEIKQNSDEMLQKIYVLLTKFERVTNGSTCWFSLSASINKKLQKFQPTNSNNSGENFHPLPTISSVPEVLTTFILYWTGLLPFFPLFHTYKIFGVICFPVTAELLHRLVKLPMPLAKVLNFFFGGHPSKILVVPKLIKHMKDRGFPCVVLGMNGVDDIAFVKKVAATGALTDHCDTIKKSPEWHRLCDDLWSEPSDFTKSKSFI